MDVILLQDVDKVGLRGEVVSVARGFMRNYLQPRRLAQPATPARVAELEKREAQRARHEAQTFEDAQKIADKLGRTELRFDVNAGPRGTLFGSVTATDVADELWEVHKIRVDRRKIDLSEPIKRIGRYEIAIALFPDVDVEVKTLVVPEGGELPPEEELAAIEAEAAAAAAAAAQAQAESEVVEEPAAEPEPAEEPAEEPDAAETAPPADEEEGVLVDPDAEPS
jgi:large subunit ribosomal protein L9